MESYTININDIFRVIKSKLILIKTSNLTNTQYDYLKNYYHTILSTYELYLTNNNELEELKLLYNTIFSY
jgi:hypothetical protein